MALDVRVHINPFPSLPRQFRTIRPHELPMRLLVIRLPNNLLYPTCALLHRDRIRRQIETLFLQRLESAVAHIRAHHAISRVSHSSSEKAQYVTHPGCCAQISTSFVSRLNHLNKKLPSALLAPYGASGIMLFIVVKLPPALLM